jgi:hypothetical protein
VWQICATRQGAACPPSRLSFIVAIYLIIVGLIGLNAIHHFIR